MRSITSLLFFAPVLALAGQGCALDLCTDFPGACGPAGQGGSGGATTSSSGTSGGGMGGAAGGGGEGGGVVIPTECDPRELGANEVIPETCGVFIDTGRATGPWSGTKAAPYNDFSLINHPDTAEVQLFYVCATPNGAPIDEQIVIERSAAIFGGFVDCTGWTVPADDATERTAWTAPQHSIPTVIRGEGVSVLLSRFAIESLDANGHDPTTLQGRSSVGMWVEDASVELVDSSVTAGAGAPGGSAAGFLATDLALGRQADPTMFDGNAGGGCDLAAGPNKIVACGGMTSIGARGGNGDITQGASGLNGSPDHNTTVDAGSGGVGEPETGAWSCTVGAGKSGDAGPNGNDGPGGLANGALSAALTSGLVHINDPGATGLNGTIGQGGGGGGGRKGGGVNGCTALQSGPSGGSGGAGGCGGLGAAGGGAGGSSIALVTIESVLTFSRSSLHAVSAGTGGDGGDGQLGGLGGNGANGGGNACRGGDGGEGGRGGNGGGGRGGASIGLAYVGPAAPSVSPDDITIASAASAGGSFGGATGNAGAEGIIAKVQEFPAP